MSQKRFEKAVKISTILSPRNQDTVIKTEKLNKIRIEPEGEKEAITYDESDNKVNLVSKIE